MKSKLLKDLCFPDKCGVYGIPAIAEDYDINKTRYLRITDISEDGKLLNDSKKSVSSDNIEKYILEEGDIVFARTGNSTGKAYFHELKNGRLAFAGFLIKFSLNPQLVNPRYLRYYTITNYYKQWVENFSLGSTRGNLNAQSFGECPIPLPNRKQQDFLVKVLSDLDAKIEVNNRINAELEGMAKLIYNYWFVQFDFPDANGKPYKSSSGKMVYNKTLKREIPEGWGSNSMADWIENDANGDWGEAEPVGKYNVKVNCIRGADLPSLDGFKENKSPIRYIHENKTHKILESNDVIVEISGGSPTQSTGRISFVTEETFTRYEAPLICANFCKAVRLKNPKNVYNFYYTWKEAFEQGNMFNYEGKTSGIRNLLFSSLVKSFKVPIPDPDLVEKFYEFMEPIQKQKQQNLLENQKLTELRDWLLPMLMNGQVTVGDAKSELGMVAEENAEYGK
tara:strand:- start:7284 stop:8636 length:1353 start_codon:yes stop_codon:yes gene_type:complete